MDDYLIAELRRLGGNRYGVVLWKGEELKYLSDVIESKIKDGHFSLIWREILENKTESFGDVSVKDGEELDRMLYEKAKEVAIEKSKLYKILFVDSAR